MRSKRALFECYVNDAVYVFVIDENILFDPAHTIWCDDFWKVDFALDERNEMLEFGPNKKSGREVDGIDIYIVLDPMSCIVPVGLDFLGKLGYLVI